MKAKNILLPSIVATSVMTLFSYLIARSAKSNFSEPALLAKIERKKLDISKPFSLPAAWATHYSVGILMVLLFNIIWRTFNIKQINQRILISSLLGGGIAIVSWRFLFTMLTRRSSSYYRKFYTQLFVAHVIFAIAVAVIQQAADEK